MADTDPLNFSRAPLAEQLLMGFEHRLQVSVTLFAPRRKGKTQFLQQDLMPLATQRGFLVAYADLWSRRDAPDRVIAMALAEALNEADLIARLKAWWARPKPALKAFKVGFSAGAAEAGANGEVELADPTAPSLHELFERFKVAGQGKALLIVDEVQHLATRPAFEDFTASLRALLSASQYQVYAVFTGSSQDGLSSMFKRTKAPFYQYGSQFDFPELGKELAEHFGRLYQNATGRSWDVDTAFERYVARGQMPPYLRQLYVKSLSHNLSISEADKQVWGSMVDEGQFVALLEGLTPLEHFLLGRIIHGEPLYSDEARQQAARALDLSTPPSATKMQAALEKMRRRGLVGNLGHGKWIIEEDPLTIFLGNYYLNRVPPQ